MEKILTCLNRMLGECRDCIPDYNQTNHPNNFDCPNYKGIKIHVFDIQENNKKYAWRNVK